MAGLEGRLAEADTEQKWKKIFEDCEAYKSQARWT
jgi:hypothetical protein